MTVCCHGDLMKKPFRVLAFAAVLSISASNAFGAAHCSGSCHGLLLEAQALEGQARYQEALARYKAAELADPKASIPLSLAAGLMLKLSTAVPKDKAVQLRDMSRAMAERASALESDDPVAQEVLRMLDDDGLSPLRVPNAKAARLMADAESAFAREDYKGALPKYEAVMQADPAYSSAWVAAGNTYYVQKDWARAEALFRRATEIEPHHSQAWRYLSDALLYQKKRSEAEAALYAAIQADPSQRPNWGKLAMFRRAAAMPLKRLALRRGVRVVQNADGKYVVEVNEKGAAEGLPDHGVRLMLGMSEYKLRTDDKSNTRSPFEIELASWRLALKVADEIETNDGKRLSDPALLQIQALARDGQLEPAILLLMFRQSYRPALDAWVAANPGGVKTFIDRYGVQP
jgi:tetratricopeptide (TPR) repeat protein